MTNTRFNLKLPTQSKATAFIGVRVSADDKTWLERYVRRMGIRSTSALIVAFIKQLRENDND